MIDVISVASTEQQCRDDGGEHVTSFPAFGAVTCDRKQLFHDRLRALATDRVTNPLDELQFRVWREFVYAYSVVVPTLDGS
jgi:hypothetical protein